MDIKPLVDRDYILEKFPGKGGWTYAKIPEIPQDKHAYFGWVKVCGSIDGYSIKNYNLMPMGNGQLFLPVKAEIRKIIGKAAGDFVRIVLCADHTLQEVKLEFFTCLEEEPILKKRFISLPENQQKKYLEWMSLTKSEDEKIARMGETLDQLSKEPFLLLYK
ncbi:MAG: DUF1905 domain-containing protein [Saprospiraceae bacterium]